jgi:type I restriction enzyme R subunit
VATTTSSLTQRPNYAAEAGWKNEAERPGYIQANKLRFLRPYQLKAIHTPAGRGQGRQDRFLFEMATGTGKTLTAAAVIKLFLRTGNARRVLFLVDRLELEDQAKKAFTSCCPSRLQDGDLQGKPRRLATRRDRRHHRAVAAVQQQVPEAVLADRLRPGHLRRSPPLHRRQRPRRVRLLHRLQAGPDRHAARLPEEVRRAKPGHPRPARAERRLLLDTYRTFGCETASRPSATRCSTA